MATPPVYEISLFSGAGGGLLGSHLLEWQPVVYVEWNRYASEVLQARIRDGLLPDAPIWNDVRSFTKRNNQCRPFIKALRQLARRSSVVLTGGFPCQPFSQAGHQRAGDDPRNGWGSTIRIIREIRPAYCLLENVAGLISGRHGYFGTVLRDLAEAGYDARWCVLSAEDIGAPHVRERVWIVATDPNSPYAREQYNGTEAGRNSAPTQDALAHADQRRWSAW